MLGLVSQTSDILPLAVVFHTHWTHRYRSDWMIESTHTQYTSSINKYQVQAAAIHNYSSIATRTSKSQSCNRQKATFKSAQYICECLPQSFSISLLSFVYPLQLKRLIASSHHKTALSLISLQTQNMKTCLSF